MTALHSYGTPDPIGDLPWYNTAKSATRGLLIVIVACSIPIVAALSYMLLW